MQETKKIPCPVCENKAELTSMQMTPELVEEMAQSETVGDPVSLDLYNKRLEICKACSLLIGGMTCAQCGCFVQFRARHITAHCIEAKW